MNNEDKIVITHTEPAEAEPARGSPGKPIGVQNAPATAVTHPDAVIHATNSPAKSL